DPARAAALAALGVEPLALDLAAPGAEARVPAVDAVVACQSAGADTAEAYRTAYVASTGALLAAARRLGGVPLVYTGSTGVFGQRDGSDVDELTPPAPAGPTGEVLAEAERLVLGAPGALGVPACLLRLSGLSGPGRAGTLDRVRTGRLALGPGDDAWMNFCHLDDAVAFTLAALDRGFPGAVYHGSDAQPPRRRELVEWVAARLGIEPPRTEAPAPPGPSRRVLSERSRDALGVTLRYPSFREGFEALM
ncbi:MAG TPA: NAD-dependent epimerase/dehydratase family protein, partial [Anaeromyxobacteraceae bacterium]|nr:NAD-dependent epimerase/dehydratase family protein [Anaeromyxobacteraceae bacterium]